MVVMTWICVAACADDDILAGSLVCAKSEYCPVALPDHKDPMVE